MQFIFHKIEVIKVKNKKENDISCVSRFSPINVKVPLKGKGRPNFYFWNTWSALTRLYRFYPLNFTKENDSTISFEKE